MTWGVRANATGRSVRGQTDKRRERRNRPPKGEPFIWLTREILESAAWRAAPLATRRFVDAVAIALMDTGGAKNGRLVVTYDQLERYGLRRCSIADAIDAAEVLGLVHVTERGGRAFADVRKPSLYALGWLDLCDGTPVANQWKRFASVDEAREAITARLSEVRKFKAAAKARKIQESQARAA